MKKSWLYITTIALIFLTIAITIQRNSPSIAAPLYQLTEFPTPTPGPDGRIMYIVQSGDTLWRISAITKIPLNELRSINGLGANDIIRPGEMLFLGTGGPSAAPTAAFLPSPTAPYPSPTPAHGAGTICVILYNDEDGDSFRQDGEMGIPHGIIDITSHDDPMTVNEETSAGEDHQCFEDLPDGDYTISIAVPDGYNPTTSMDYSIRLDAGDQAYVSFGAQPNSETLDEMTAPLGETKSPLLGIIGGVILFAGLFLAAYSWFYKV